MSGSPRRARFSFRRATRRQTLLAAAAVCTVAIITALAVRDYGPLSRHMLVHVALMNVLAPLIALALLQLPRTPRVEFLFTAMLVQFGGLALLHTPVGFHAAMSNRVAALAALGFVLLAAVWFWECVWRQLPLRRWRAVLALLVTGKLYCLLGVLLLFAPRMMYSHGPGGSAALADQQSAGLLMLIACPLTYIAAAVFLCVRWLDDLGISDQAISAGRDPA